MSRKPKLTANVLDGLIWHATYCDSWREADGDETVDAKDAAAMDSAAKWLKGMTEHRAALARAKGEAK